MPFTQTLDLWQEEGSDAQSGLSIRRSTVIPDEYAALAKKERQPRRQLTNFLRGLKSKCRSHHRRTNTTSSEQTSEQHSSFRRSMIASARLEKENTRFKPPNKLANALCSSPLPEQVVWRKERSPMTEGHPVLRANPDIYIPSENDKAIHWALDQIFSPNNSQISFTSNL